MRHLRVHRSQKQRELGYGHFGHGIVVWDRLHEKDGDYDKVAFISQTREVSFLVSLSAADQQEIEGYARTANPSVSSMQNQPVFSVPAQSE